MKEFKLFLLVIASSLLSILVHAQGATLLKTEQGVSLSYTREFYKKCKETPDREYNIYKITVYLSNNSGKSIKMASSWVSNNNSRYLNCISEYDNFGSMTFKPSGDLNATPEWDTRGKPWPSNSTLKGIYYIAVPIEDGEPPKPDWSMGGFVFVDDKKTYKAQPQWSEWKTDDCFSGLKYRVLGKEIYDLNRQYHYYFEFINEYKETIFFDFNLLDKNGKIRFGDRHTIRPEKNLAFNHKMTDNYIVSFSTEKVCFKLDNKNYSPCLTAEEDKDKMNAALAQKPVQEKKQETKTNPSNTKPPNFIADNKQVVLTVFEKSEWKNEEGMTNQKIEMATDGLHWMGINPGFYDLYKKTSATTYQLGEGKNYCIIEFLENNRIKHLCSGSPYIFYYTRLSNTNANETITSNQSKKTTPSETEEWQQENNGEKIKITMMEDGLKLTQKGQDIEFQKISSDEYKYISPGAQVESSLKFINNHKRLIYSFKNLSNAAYNHDDLYNLISASNEEKEKSSTDSKSISLEGEWEGEGYSSSQKMKITMTPEGINETNHFYNGVIWQYKKIAPDTYRYTYNGTKGSDYFTIKFINSNKIQVFRGMIDQSGFFCHRLLSLSEETKINTPNEKKSPSVAGTWNGDNGRSGTIVMASDGFTWTNQGESNGYLFKKTGNDTYRFDDGGNYCIVKFLSDTKLDYSCNGSHYAYFERRQ